MIAPVQQREPVETLGVQPDFGPSNLKSFSTVAVGLGGFEAALLVTSIRLYSDLPIYIFADEYAISLLEEHIGGFDNIDVTLVSKDVLVERRKEFPEKLSSVWLNGNSCEGLFPPEVLGLKMDAMLKAIRATGNTLLVDADVVFVNKLPCKFTDSLVLSPHFGSLNGKQGIYNAGYVYSDSTDFPYYWKKMFEEDSLFFEQECMDRFPFNFDTNTFSEAHNFGLWRTRMLDDARSPVMHMRELGLDADKDFLKDGYCSGITLNGKSLISFHVHLRPKNLQKDMSYNLVNVFYECMKRSEDKKHRKLMSFINNKYIPSAFLNGLGES